MYKIIGGDGKEYGPISAEQLKQWFAEGRLNGQTQVQSEGGEWRPLSSHPDLVGTPPPPPPAIPGAGSFKPLSGGGTQSGALEAVKGPATMLLVLAIVCLVFGVFSLLANVFQLGSGALQQNPEFGKYFSGTFGVIGAIISMIFNAVILFGAIKMKRLESYGLAMAVSIMALLCSNPCCCPVGLAAGIWSLVVLTKPEVRSAFN